jgi:type IV pilus biogenesis protein CpaD/CtpE
MTTRIIVALAAIGTLAGCATTATEADFGNSVTSLIGAQTANPATLTNPSVAPVTGVDPDYANNVVEQFRKDVSKPDKIKEPIEMVFMGGQGGRSQ